jgi:lactoylglutathione lyase
MRLNHINIAVDDVTAARGFLETYFGFRCLSERGAEAIAIMADNTHFVVALTNFKKVDEVSYPEEFHTGFFLDTAEQVDQMFERLTADGFAPAQPKHFHGAWTFYVKAPGGFTVEIGHQPGVRNAAPAAVDDHVAA